MSRQCQQTTKMYRHLHTCFLLLIFLVSPWSTCKAEECSVSDIQGIQPAIDLATEKLDGHWFVTHVYMYDEGASDIASVYTSYTVDVVPTERGLTLYHNKNDSSSTTCDYMETELNATSQPLRLSTTGIPNGNETALTVLVAAADNDARHVMFYFCHGDVTQQQLCTGATALLAGRQFNVTAARNWLNSVSTSPPCFTGAPIVVQEGAECPLKPFWNMTGRDCDVRSFPVQGNFDLNKYIAKTWYEMTWLAPEYIDPIYYYQDYQHEYEMQPNNSIIVRASGRNEKNECFFQDVSLTTTSTPGKLTWHEVPVDVPYNVIQTDYDHYAVVFGCYNMTSSGMCMKARGWLWSRSKTLDRRYRLAAHSKMQDLCLNPAAFFPTEHKNECVRDTGGSTSLRALVVLTAAMLIFVVSLTT